MSLNRKLIEKTDHLLSKEKGTIFKDPGGRINICLVYPNTYHIGMSNLGFQGIYNLLNQRNDVVCERAFLPDDEGLDEHIRTETEIFSLESKKPLNRFDVVAFSVSFENDYPNILQILKLSKIPFRSSERNERHPILLLGGVCPSFNPEPLADFFDICFIGEAEEMLNEFIDVFNKSSNRDELFKNSLSIGGIYIPRFYEIDYSNGIFNRSASDNAPEKIKKRFIENLSEKSVRHSILSSETEFSNMYLIEAMRGCQWKCNFCVAGHIYTPVRNKNINAMQKEISSALNFTSKIGIIGPSLGDYPEICSLLETPGVTFSITSLRANPKSAELVKLLKDNRSISIAPEAGTERLRKAINKKISEENIIETAKTILEHGIENLRLYFMIGLPTEIETDIEGIIELVKKIRSTSKQGNISLTISTFVPKPFTPFQWHPMEKIETVKAKLNKIKKSLLTIKSIKVSHDVPKYAYMQGLFSSGDRRISKVLEKMLKIPDWKQACSDAGIKPDFYIFRNKNNSETLPWDFLDTGNSKERLWSEYQNALKTK
jgi:radical SAM superfamily enzyme YgiQ (UPF0313 family)